MDGYKRGGHSKYDLKVHIILVTKYRRKIFNNLEVKNHVKQIVRIHLSNYNCEIIEMEIDKDHIHILLQYNPIMSISNIVRLLKQYTTHYAWRSYCNILKKYYWKRKILWSDGYFACSIGQVSQEIIEKYIQNQG